MLFLTLTKVNTKAVKHLIIFSSAVLLASLMGCIEGNDDSIRPLQAYYKPVYANKQDLFRIKVQAAKPLSNPGRIYLKDKLLIINERFQGFHIIDNTDPADPKPLLFLEVPGAVNMAMQGQYLYADNITDLLTIDLGDLQQIREVNRQKNTFTGNQNYPPFRDVGFECVDASRGVVVGWEEAPMPATKPECWR